MKSISSREKVFGLVFVAALAWGAWNYRHLLPGGRPAAESPVITSPAQVVATTTAAAVQANPGSPAQTVQQEWGQDPFNRAWRRPGARPTGVASTAKKQALWLTAIVVRPTQRYAVINGRIVKEGQEVAGRTVTRIEATRVLVDDNGVEVTLTL